MTHRVIFVGELLKSLIFGQALIMISVVLSELEYSINHRLMLTWDTGKLSGHLVGHKKVEYVVLLHNLCECKQFPKQK